MRYARVARLASILVALSVTGCGVVSADVPLLRRPGLCDHYERVVQHFDATSAEVVASLGTPRRDATVRALHPAVTAAYESIPRLRDHEEVSPLLALAYTEFLLGVRAMDAGDSVTMERNLRDFRGIIGAARLEGTTHCVS